MKRGFIATTILAIVMMIMVLPHGQQVLGSPDWLTNWTYRKQLTINGTTAGAQSDYTMLARFHKWLAWQCYSGNPVISPSQSWETIGIYGISVITDEYATPVMESGEYRGYWGGFNGTADSIGTGNSSDGISWTKYASNPVVVHGAPGTWNEDHVNDPTVVKVAGIYRLWYTGSKSGDTEGAIGYANSTDGTSWTPYTSNPVLPAGYSASEYNPVRPSVIYENSTYRMWYVGIGQVGVNFTQQGIFYATSSDGINWTRQGRVIYDVSLTDPVVKRLNSTTLVMICADDFTSGRYSTILTSPDGITWTYIDSGEVQIPDLVHAPYGEPISDLVRMGSEWWAYTGEKTIVAGATHIGLLKGTDYAASVGCGQRAEIGLNFSVQDDFDDVRLTRSDGTTLLDYWPEPTSSIYGQYSSIWIECDSIAASPNSTPFYVYYGNPGAGSQYATSLLAGEATFRFFDDFSGTYPGTKWTGDTALGSVAGGVLTCAGNGAWRAIRSAIGLDQNTGAVRASGYTSSGMECLWGLRGVADGGHRSEWYSEGSNRWLRSMNGTSYGDAATNYTTSGSSYTTWDNLVRGGVNMRAFQDTTQLLNSPKTGTPSNTTDMSIIIATSSNSATIYKFDWVLVRKYIYAEPTWAAFGSEEQEEGCSPSISLNTNSWSVNGGSAVSVSSNYSTGLTYFNVTNNSGGAVDITISGISMAGEGYTWTLSDSATPGNMIYGLKAGLEGGSYDTVVKLNSPYNTLVASLPDGDSQLFGLNLYTPTVYSDGNTKTGTVTITAACS